MSRSTLFPGIFTLLFFDLASPAIAISYCNDPSEPYCVDSFGDFDTEYEFESCKSDVEQYADDMQDYVNCMVDEANQAVNAARLAENESANKVNDVIEKFNCKARRERLC